MKNANFKQTYKVGQAGSFINQLMSNNASAPVVGEWATICFYSDRDVCKVVEVSNGGARAVVELYNTTATEEGKAIGMGHQDWKHEATGGYETYVYRRGAWYREYTEVVYTKEFIAKAEAEGNEWALYRSLTKDQYEAVYGEAFMPANVVEGITKAKKAYSKVRVMFGVCNYHYDWTF